MSSILSNITWLLAGHVLKIINVLIVTPIIARYLGVELYGIINYSISFVALFMMLPNLGLSGIVVNETIQLDRSGKQVLLSSVFMMKFVAGLLATLCCLALVWSLDIDRLVQILVSLWSLSLILSSFEVVDAYFQSIEKNKFTVWSQSIALFISVLAKIIFVVLEGDIFCLCLIMLTEISIAIVFRLYFLTRLRQIFPVQLQIDWRISRDLLGKSWPLIISGSSAIVYLKIDQVMLGYMLDNASVGLYAAASKLSEATYILPTAVTIAVFPTLIRSKKQDKQIYDRRIQTLFDVMGWSAIGISIVVTIFSRQIIGFFYGIEFQAAANIISIHIWASLFIFWGRILSRWLIVEDFLKFSLIRHLAGASLNLLLNFWLIPIYGVQAAAVSTVLSYACASFVICLFFTRSRPIGLAMLKSFTAPIRYGGMLIEYAKYK